MDLPVMAVGKSAAVQQLTVSDNVFARDYNEPLVHQIVVAQMAAERQGTKAQKTRSEVRGGGRKPWRQKGTGNARAGTIRSPIWVGGGRALAAKPRDYSQKVNKKMYRAAMATIVSELARQQRLVILDNITCENPKTKELVAQLEQLNISNALIVTRDFDDNLYLAARNIPNIDVATANDADAVSLIGYERVIMTVAAAKQLEENLG